MNPQDLIEMHDRRPFLPFAIHLSDGRKFPVNHHEFLARSPDGSRIIYWYPDMRSEVIDLDDVGSLEELPVKQNGRGKKR